VTLAQRCSNCGLVGLCACPKGYPGLTISDIDRIFVDRVKWIDPQPETRLILSYIRLVCEFREPNGNISQCTIFWQSTCDLVCGVVRTVVVQVLCYTQLCWTVRRGRAGHVCS
jgi:hypothetical protein